MYSVDFKVKYFNSIALFYTMLRGKYLVPVSTISEIVGELSVTHELEYEFLKNQRCNVEEQYSTRTGRAYR